MLNFTAANITGGESSAPSEAIPIRFATTIPPSSLWSFMLAAYGDITDEEALQHSRDHAAWASSSSSRSSQPPPSIVPSGWVGRSFTLISAIGPDAAMAASVRKSEGGADSSDDGSGSSSSKFYGTGPATTATLRAARSASGPLDTYTALFAGSGSGATVLYGRSSADGSDVNISGTSPSVSSYAFDNFLALGEINSDNNNKSVDVFFSLSASARAQLRRRAIHSMLQAAADATANLLLGLVVEGSLRPLAARSSDLQRAERAVADAIVKVTGVAEASSSSSTASPLALSPAASHGEAHRLLYCLAGNAECAYMQQHNYALGHRGRIPSESTEEAETVAGDSPLPIAPANYYHTVFGFYRAIPPQQRIAQQYLADRLKSSYRQRIGAHNKVGDSNSGDSDGEEEAEAALGSPCDPFAAKGPYAFGMRCPARYQQCLPHSNHSGTSSSSPSPSDNGYGCYGQAAFYSHAFAPATTYNPRRPSVASFVSDWAYINGVPAARRASYENTTVGENATATSVFVSSDQIAGLFYALRIEVESYWSVNTALGFGARLGLSASPAALYLGLGIGLVTFVAVIAVCIAYCFCIEPRILSRREADERDAAGATETRSFYPLHGNGGGKREFLPSSSSSASSAAAASQPAVPAREPSNGDDDDGAASRLGLAGGGGVNLNASGTAGYDAPQEEAEEEVPKGAIRYA